MENRNNLEIKNLNEELELLKIKIQILNNRTCETCINKGKCAIYDNFNIQYCSDFSNGSMSEIYDFMDNLNDLERRFNDATKLIGHKNANNIKEKFIEIKRLWIDTDLSNEDIIYADLNDLEDVMEEIMDKKSENSCITSGTKVYAETGVKNIEDVKIGDKINSCK